MAERLREFDRRFQRVGQFEAEGLTFLPLWHDAIYAYLLNHVNVYISYGYVMGISKWHFTAPKDPFMSQ